MAPRHKLLATLIVVVLVSIIPFTLPEVTRAQNNDELIRMTVTVWNNKGPVKGLTREAFQVADEKVAKQVELFEADDAPISIGLLIDTSGSMNLGDLREKIYSKPGEEVISLFIQRGNQNNEYFVGSFDSTSRLLADWSTASNLLSRTTNISRPKGQFKTVLYDACFAAIEKMQTAHHSRRALIVITDGQDNESQHKFKELRNMLRDSDILFYAIAVADSEDVASSLGMEGQTVLEELASVTGGRVYYPREKKEMAEVFSTMNDELHNQYRVGFRRGQLDPVRQWRQIKLKISPQVKSKEFKNLSFRTRQGYYTK